MNGFCIKSTLLTRLNVNKMANHNIKAFSLLRHKFPKLLIPLWWIIEYRGEVFEVQSIAPISINTLVYGSDTHGINYTAIDLTAEEIANDISDFLNCKPHKFKDLIEVDEKWNEKMIYLPYSVQLHQCQGLEDEVFYHIVNPGALFCWDSILTNDPENAPNLIVRQLRPEWIMNNISDEVAEGFIKQTWINPVKWMVWGNFIRDYEYFYYEKRNLDRKRTILTQYHCWIQCYYEVNADINSRVTVEENPLLHKYPWHKFEKKELPLNKRGIVWLNSDTGTISPEAPMKKSQLNPDACFNSLGIESSEEDIGDIIKSKRKLMDETLSKIIEDLDNDELNVTTPSELCQMFKELGINMRHIRKVASNSEKDHIKELAITEIVWRKIIEVAYEGLDYQEVIDTDVFDKISLNMMNQRLSELVQIPLEILSSIDYKSPEPFKEIEIPDLRYKEWRWTPLSMQIQINEARKLDILGKEAKDEFSPVRKNREIATDYFK